MVGHTRRCEVCGVREKVVKGFFASFPRDELRCKIWVKQVGQEELVHLPIEKLANHRHVCAAHFEKRDFSKSGKKLRKRAYPKLQLTAPPLTDRQLRAFPLHVASYFKLALAPIIVGEAASSAPVTSSSKTPFVIVTTQNNTMEHSVKFSSDCDKSSLTPILNAATPGEPESKEHLVKFSLDCDNSFLRPIRNAATSGEPESKGKSSTEFQQSEGRLQGETHKDHTYDVTDRTILTVRTERILEKCIDLNPGANNTQIEAAPEIEPVPEVEEAFDPDYELHVSPSPLPEVEDSGGEAVFSWQRDEELIEADDAEEPPAPAPPPPADPTLALFCESDPDPRDPAHAAAGADPGPEFDPDPDVVFDPQPDQAVPSVPAPVDNRCKDCEEVNEGFEFWCVQCAGGALCGACAGRAPHHAHYVLRAPMGCSRARTQAVVSMIRQQAVLLSLSQQMQTENLSRHGTVDDDLKLEVKEEPAEVPPAESSAAEPDPLACASHEPISLDDTLEPEFPDDLIEPLEPVSLRSPISLHSPRSSSRPHSPISVSSCPASPPEPVVTPELATHEVDKCIAEKIVEHHEPLQPGGSWSRLRKPTDAHEPILVPTQRKLVKVSSAEVKRAFLSHIERVVTTQNKQLKVYQPHVKLTPEVRDNVVATQHEGPTYEGNSRTTRLQARGQAPMKVTFEPKPSQTGTIDDDIPDETIEYLEEELDSDIETVDNVDNHEADVLDEDDFDDDVLDEDYLIDEGDLEEAELEEDDVSDEEIIVRNVPGRGVKRKKDAEETLPVKGPSESMVRALPTKAVIKVRPLSSLEIRNWTADRKRLRND